MADSVLDAPLAPILGDKTSRTIKRVFGFATVGQLLADFPRKYVEKGELTGLGRLPYGEEVTVVAQVAQVTERRAQRGGQRIQEMTVTDGTGRMRLTFFNQHWLIERVKPGAVGMFSGKVGRYMGMPQLTHPDFELFDADEGLDEGVAIAAEWAERPIPVYAATSSFPSKRMRRAVGLVLDHLRREPGLEVAYPDIIPEAERAARALMRRAEAVLNVHRPQRRGDWARARATLRYEEAVVTQGALWLTRQARRAEPGRVRTPGHLLAEFDARLPFELTEGQREASREIQADLASETPMNRLLQGEVGSGKTVVALRAMLTVAEDGGQSALLAPTEILAQQHLSSIRSMLGPDLAARLNPVLVTGSQPAAQRRRAALALASGQSRIAVGTHAILSDTTMFYDLGLAVIDEQHRFGVQQREALSAKGGAHTPHLLLLTATPIPRTVAMTVFGDLDISSLRELPAGRRPISTFVVPLAERPAWYAQVWRRLGEEIAAGRQGYVVTGLIEEDEAGELQSVASALAEVRERLPGVRAAALHGRMPADEKDQIMSAYAAGDLDVLVATTVVEVGVDVPNATVMVVLDADRFGVSQLHQLRGRIGRGEHASIALFVTSAPEGSVPRQRVEAVAASNDGFELAEADLRLRSEGDVLGLEQSGAASSLRILRVSRDPGLIRDARALIERLADGDPLLERQPALRAQIARTVTDDQARHLSVG